MKKLIDWEEKYCVGFPEIDNQHKELVNIINKLYNSILSNITVEKLKDILTKMDNYVDFHFSFEEDLFKKHNYNNTTKHINEHKRFQEKIREFAEKLTKGENEIAIEILSYLRFWLVKHIMFEDKKFVTFYNNK